MIKAHGKLPTVGSVRVGSGRVVTDRPRVGVARPLRTPSLAAGREDLLPWRKVSAGSWVNLNDHDGNAEIVNMGELRSLHDSGVCGDRGRRNVSRASRTGNCPQSQTKLPWRFATSRSFSFCRLLPIEPERAYPKMRSQLSTFSLPRQTKSIQALRRSNAGDQPRSTAFLSHHRVQGRRAFWQNQKKATTPDSGR